MQPAPKKTSQTSNRPVDFVLRFRDHGEPPIHAHREILKTYKQTWWGWWKRPYESSNLGQWQKLHEQIAKNGSAVVGLFDTDNRCVYPALAVDVKLPAQDGKKPEVPDDEQYMVPDYYEAHVPSSGWVKLSCIDDPLDFFGAYSYAAAPEWTNCAAQELQWLVDKVILDAEELGGMNVTFWAVRPSKEGDPRGRLIVMFPTLTEPVSADVIRCQSSKILHITDPHFAVESNREKHVWRLEGESGARDTMADAILSAIKREPIGLVVVTGDLTFTADPAEFAQAQKALRRILDELCLDEDHLIVIPGNHDIEWKMEEIYNGQTQVREASPEATKNYRDFYKSMFRHFPNPNLSMGRRYLLPNGPAVEICGLNSSCLETGKRFLPGIGLIDEPGFDRVKNILGWNDEKSLALRILAVHHHLAVTENIEPKQDFLRGYGLAVNAVRIQRKAARLGVQLALHGHKHRSFIWRSTVYELPEHTHDLHSFGDLSILGGGSAGSVETDSNTTYFNLIDVAPGGIEVEIFRSNIGTGFTLGPTWLADFQIDEGRLVMEKWRPKSVSVRED